MNETQQVSQVPKIKKAGLARYVMVGGTFLLALLLYIDRVCISVAKEPIVGSLGFSDKMMGWVLSAFSLGYALFQTPGGLLSDRLGPRRVLAAIVSFWSVFTALTASAWNFASMLVFRLMFGAGEAGAFPGIARAVYSWIPVSERGIVNGVNFSGSRLGAAFALPLVAWMIDAYGWRWSFVLLGLVGLLWAIIWYFFFRDDPATHPMVSEEEKAYIENTRQQSDETEENTAKLSVGKLLGSNNMLLAMGQYFCSNFTFFFALTWLYPHLKSTYNLDTVEAGWYAGLPLVGGALGNWFAGWLTDRIYAQGRWKASRSIPAMIGFALAAVGLLGSVFMNNVGGAIFFLTVAIFGADMTLPPSWSFCVDIGKKNSGAVSGTMNMAGNLGAFLTALAWPYLQDWTQSVTPFFYIGAGLNVIALFLWMKTNPEKSIL